MIFGQVEAILDGGGAFVGSHFGGIGCHTHACVGMFGQQTHRTSLPSMATPEPTRNMGVSGGVAMAPRAGEFAIFARARARR